jgi:hypothetical protein
MSLIFPGRIILSRRRTLLSGTIRTTRICSVNQFHPKLRQAFQDYFQAHNFGNLDLEAILCCETLTDRTGRSRLTAWLEGYPDEKDYLGLVLTEQYLLWARTGERSGTIAAGVELKNIRVDRYESRLPRESGLDIYGFLLDSKGRIRGKLALGPEEAAVRFCEQTYEAAEKQKPPPKKRQIPWLKFR